MGSRRYGGHVHHGVRSVQMAYVGNSTGKQIVAHDFYFFGSIENADTDHE